MNPPPPGFAPLPVGLHDRVVSITIHYLAFLLQLGVVLLFILLDVGVGLRFPIRKSCTNFRTSFFLLENRDFRTLI